MYTWEFNKILKIEDNQKTFISNIALYIQVSGLPNHVTILSITMPHTNYVYAYLWQIVAP